MVGVLAALALAAAPAPADPVSEIDGIVQQRFYSQARLKEVGWSASVETARGAYRKAADEAARHEVLRALMASLKSSHTAYYPREDPSYWALASIFEPFLTKSCPRERTPAFPVTRDDIGAFWRRSDDAWFVAGVYRGGPAEKAGLKSGDRVATADGKPFGPVASFAGKAGKAVALEVQRARGGPLLKLSVTPRATKPLEEFRQATEDSFQVVERRGRRIAYLRVWSWTGPAVQGTVEEAIGKANNEKTDGFVLDLRDGWGGADPSYLAMFFHGVPVLSQIGRDGGTQRYDRQVRTPAVVLVNGGSRSGKEAFAYGAKKHHLASVVGERTAGGVLFGTPICLGDGSLLWLAVMDATVDGERLEGVGVEPDVAVPFDPRYAAGADPQLERALDLLSGG
ncbi:MAG TPA: S41 family peptidase [Myxococcaceae bacterium]|nr:S41 family peptidase [Myxococcaceae bacterium]